MPFFLIPNRLPFPVSIETKGSPKQRERLSSQPFAPPPEPPEEDMPLLRAIWIGIFFLWNAELNNNVAKASREAGMMAYELAEECIGGGISFDNEG